MILNIKNSEETLKFYKNADVFFLGRGFPSV
jgi:hypothetical protein